MATVQVPGGPVLHYQEWGRPDGSVVLLLHGLTSSSDDWRNVAPVLGEGFRVIAPDARGHGGSEWTAEYSLDLMRSDVEALMDQLGILAAIVVGHSMGALVAYQLAALRPERVRLLVLEDMPPPVPANPPKSYPRNPEEDFDWHAQIAVFRWRNNPPAEWAGYAAKIQAKTLVLGGARSHIPQGSLKELAERIPHAEFVSLDRGHDIHAERPSEFLTHVQPFIAWFAK